MKGHWAIISAGLALFSMFFGAGNLVFPLVLGEAAGTQNLWAVLGLMTTGVLFPLIGLLAIMLFDGNHHRFFGKLGKIGVLLYFVIQLVMGPLGSIPRLFTVSYGSLAPYFPSISLAIFSVIAAVILLVLILRPSRLLDLLGSVLTPALLLALGSIIVLGLIHPPAAVVSHESASHVFFDGALVGYGTLDLLAAFLFGKFVLGQFKRSGEPRKAIVKKFLKASVIASVLLGLVYGGLSYVAAFHLHDLPAGIAPEGLLSALAVHILGPYGALAASIAVIMACLTTALTQTAIFSEYLRQDIFRGKLKALWAGLITLTVAGGIANLGFAGIMAVLGPIIQVAYPVCIGLSIWNIASTMRQKQLPVVQNPS